MRRLNKLGLSVIATVFCAASIAACSASGNDVAGNPAGGGGAGSGDGGAVTDSSYGGDASSQSDSGSGTDSGTTKIDSGTIDDAGVIFTGGGTCDITDGLTLTVEELITFITENSPASCDSSTPCDSSHCCLDLTAASGGGGLGLPSGGICLTTFDLSSLGL
ncbi:MAG: hypothetical protein ACRELY_05140 [Polyangiaceae bacterium]